MAASKATGAALLAPEVAAPVAVAQEAKRLWGGLVEALGKDAYESVTIKVGRKTVYKSRTAAGVTRELDLRGAQKVRTERVAVARWELVPLVILASAAAGYAAAETPQGQAAIGRVTGSSRYQDVRHPLAAIKAKAATSLANSTVGGPGHPTFFNPFGL